MSRKKYLCPPFGISIFFILSFIFTFLKPASSPGLGPAPFPTGPVDIPEYSFNPEDLLHSESGKYEFSWNGIKAAEVSWEVSEDPERPGWLCARAEGKIIGFPALLYRANDSVESCMNLATLEPDRYQIRIRETLDYYDMEVTFDHQKKEALAVKKTRRKIKEKRFEFKNALGPLSAAALIRALPWKPGDRRVFEVIDGNERYLLVMEAVEEKEIQTPAGTFSAVKLQPSIFTLPKTLDRENASWWKKQKRKEKNSISQMYTFEFWMAKEPPRPFLSARTDVYFGHIDMTLVEYNPS